MGNKQKNKACNLVLKGLRNGILHIIYSNDPLSHCGCEGICCQCGGNCFYFSDTAEYTSLESFFRSTNVQDNAKAIADTICDDFLADPEDSEGNYILSYISEKLPRKLRRRK